MKITAEPRSDQLNADDLIGTTRTVTIAGVSIGTADQKYDIHLVDEKRVWRPPLSVLRVMLAIWGDDSEDWVGESVTLYCDPSVRFGKDEVGGIRISHATRIDQPTQLKVTESRGKRKIITIMPLAANPASPFDPDTCDDPAELRRQWKTADPATRSRIEARVTALAEQTP